MRPVLRRLGRAACWVVAVAGCGPLAAQNDAASPEHFGDRQRGYFGDAGDGYFGDPSVGNFAQYGFRRDQEGRAPQAPAVPLRRRLAPPSAEATSPYIQLAPAEVQRAGPPN